MEASKPRTAGARIDCAYTVDDTNDNGTADGGEQFAILTNSLVPLCHGTVATLNDVTVNFSTFTATAASVVKDPDTCAGTPTATPHATRSPQTTATATPNGGGGVFLGTPTPNATATSVAAATQTAAATGTPYSYGASLNAPSSNWLALASGLGIIGLLVPRRRRRRR